MQDESGRGQLRQVKEKARNRKPAECRGPDTRLCISVPEAAAMLGVSRNFGYELARRKELPVVKFGNRLLIPRAALEKMLERGARE